MLRIRPNSFYAPDDADYIFKTQSEILQAVRKRAIPDHILQEANTRWALRAQVDHAAYLGLKSFKTELAGDNSLPMFTSQ